MSGAQSLGTYATRYLQPHGIYVKLAVDAVKWFLSCRGDPQLSYSMEYATTEFKAQGLEVDWACVAWDADLRYTAGAADRTGGSAGRSG